MSRVSKKTSHRPELKNRPFNYDLLSELRDKIFATRRGGCLDSHQLTKFYTTRKPMPRATLSHLVSCQECLDKANHLLELPPLRERNVIDVLGRTTEFQAN